MKVRRSCTPNLAWGGAGRGLVGCGGACLNDMALCLTPLTAEQTARCYDDHCTVLPYLGRNELRQVGQAGDPDLAKCVRPHDLTREKRS